MAWLAVTDCLLGLAARCQLGRVGFYDLTGTEVLESNAMFVMLLTRDTDIGQGDSTPTAKGSPRTFFQRSIRSMLLGLGVSIGALYAGHGFV